MNNLKPISEDIKPISEDIKQDKTVLHNSTQIQKTLKRIKHKLIPILLIASLAGCSKEGPLQQDDQVEDTTPEPATPATDAERAKEKFDHMKTVCKAHGLIDNEDNKARQNFFRIFIKNEKLGLFEPCAKSELDAQGEIGRWVKADCKEDKKFIVCKINDEYVDSEGKKVKTVTTVRELKDKNLYNETESAQTLNFMFPFGASARTGESFVFFQDAPILYGYRLPNDGGNGKREDTIPIFPVIGKKDQEQDIRITNLENTDKEHTKKLNELQNANTNQKPTEADLDALAKRNATR